MVTKNQIDMAFNEFIDDDTLATASPTNVVSGEAIKAYVDANIGTTTPTVQIFTSGSGTYTTPANVTYIQVKMVGGGGGGGNGGSAAGVAGGNGGNTTFGSSLLTAAGGTGGGWANTGGSGGAATVNAPAIQVVSATGEVGTLGGATSNVTSNVTSGRGGSTLFGTGGRGGYGNANGSSASTNSGGGGGGGGVASSTGFWAAGVGGGAGAYVEAIINSPSASYSYSVGAAGTAGTGGTNGGAGSAGQIVVTEYY